MSEPSGVFIPARETQSQLWRLGHNSGTWAVCLVFLSLQSPPPCTSCPHCCLGLFPWSPRVRYSADHADFISRWKSRSGTIWDEGPAWTCLPGNLGTRPLTAEPSARLVGRLIFLSWLNAVSASLFQCLGGGGEDCPPTPCPAQTPALGRESTSCSLSPCYGCLHQMCFCCAVSQVVNFLPS